MSAQDKSKLGVGVRPSPALSHRPSRFPNFASEDKEREARPRGVECEQAAPGQKKRFSSFRGRPMVLRSYEIEIENSGPGVRESEEAAKMEYPVRSKFPQSGLRRSPNLTQDRPSVEGEFQ